MSWWDRPIFFAAVISFSLSLVAVGCLIALGMGVAQAFAVGGLCWVFGMVATIPGTGRRI